MPGLLEGYEQSWTAGVKDPSWGTEIEVRKVNWGTPQIPGRETLSLEIPEQGRNKTKAGEVKDWDREQFQNTQEGHEDLNAWRYVTRGVTWLPSSWPHVLRSHCPPSVPPVCQSVLSWELWVCMCSDNSSQGWFLCQQAPSLKGPFPDSTPQLLCILEP